VIPMAERIDLLCAGRICVDLYGEQVGATLEGTSSFAKYLGGSAANICVGTQRLGLRTAMLTRVGDEPMGYFLRSELAREGVDVSGVRVDPERLSGVVMLAVRESDDFPRIFYYADSADMALGPEDVDPSLVSRAGDVLLTGSYLSSERLRAAMARVVSLAKGSGARIALDLDVRPGLWGLAPLAAGNATSVIAPEVADAFKGVLGDCDLVVGTREEIMAAASLPDVDEALRDLRDKTDAVIVVKAGVRGCTVIEGAPAPHWEDGTWCPGFRVEVLNTVGAGDGFMAGFMSRWLKNEPPSRCAEAGNAAGAIVVSRHGCSPAMPTAAELASFLARYDEIRRPQDDRELVRLHRVGTRRGEWPRLHVLAIDHRWQLEELASEVGVHAERITELKRLVYAGYLEVARHRDDTGLLVDSHYGGWVLEAESGSGRWLARAIEIAGTRPVEVEGEPELADTLRRWPAEQVVKVIVYWHREDPPGLVDKQRDTLLRLQHACESSGHELLVELQAPRGTRFERGAVAATIADLYGDGLRPEWWKLPPMRDAATWQQVGNVVRANDSDCRGLLVLGHESSPDDLALAFAAGASEPACVGFAVGRRIFADPARRWFAGEIDSAEVVERVRSTFSELIELWSGAKERAPGPMIRRSEL
jgi:5-dehydro-2-deoxygluconokinase